MKTWLIILMAALVLVAAAKRLRPVQHFGRIAGQVMDEKGEPIPWSSIVIEGTSIETLADSSGHYCLTDIRSGVYNISATTVGYNKSTAESLIVIADSISVQDFQLEADAFMVKDINAPARRQTVARYPACNEPPVERFGGIGGQVLDDKDEPIPGSSIVIVGTSIGTSADISGHYCLTDIRPGIYNIRAMNVGYSKSTALRLVVIADSISVQDFQLEADALMVKDTNAPARRQTVAHYPGCDR